MRRIESDADLAAVRVRGAGVVYNDFSPNLGTPEHNRLHLAACRWLARASTTVAKFADDDPASAIAWLEQHRGPEGVAWFRCATCLGRPAAPHHRAPAPSPRPVRARVPAWRVEVVDGEVVADLPRTIQFPSGSPLPEWMTAARAALRARLRDLAIEPGQVLEATFAGHLDSGTDLENVLLYNVGVPAAVLRSGLRLRRAPQADERVTQRYRAVAPRPSSLDAASVIATLSAPVDRAETASARRLWAALRRHATFEDGPAEATHDVALRVTLGGPWQLRTEAVKRILDAACAAFHVHDGTALDVVAPTLAAELGTTADEVRTLALDPRGAALGPAPFLAPWGRTVRVHPADDRIAAVDLDVVAGDELRLEATLLAV